MRSFVFVLCVAVALVSCKTEFEWLGEPVYSYDIIVDEAGELYLCIDQGKLRFTLYYDENKCTFYEYLYASSGPPSKGNAVAFSQQAYEAPLLASSTLAAESTKSTPKLTLMDFPTFMLGTVEQNSRFWYKKINADAKFTLESAENPGWYLSKNPTNNDATLSNKPLLMSIEPSK